MTTTKTPKLMFHFSNTPICACPPHRLINHERGRSSNLLKKLRDAENVRAFVMGKNCIVKWTRTLFNLHDLDGC